MAMPWEEYQAAAAGNAAGASGSGGDMPAVDTSSTWDSLAPRVVHSLARDLSITPDQAAGIVGQLGFESNGLQAINERNPVVPGSRGGFGWAQWTGPRRRAFEQWSADHNLSPDSEEANYGFMVHEIDTTERGVLDKIRAAPDARTAGRVFTNSYLRPGIASQDKRDSWTDKALNLLVPKAQAGTLSESDGPWMDYQRAASAQSGASAPGSDLMPWEEYAAAQTASRARAMDSGMVGSEALDEALANRTNRQAAAGADDQGDFMRRFNDAFRQSGALAAGAIGLAGDSASRAGVPGAKSLSDWGYKTYQEGMKVTQDRAKPSDDVMHVWEEAKQGNFGPVVDYVQGAAGYLTAQGLEALAAAGIGAVAGSAIPGAGTLGGAALGVAEKGVLKKIIGKSVESAIAKRMEKNVARGMTEEAATAAARQQLGKEIAGAILGSQAFNMSQELGTTYGGARDEKKGGELTGGELAKAGTFGTMAALTETVGDMFGIGQFFAKAPTKEAASGLVAIVQEIARRARNGALFEGAQELVQTFLERVGAGQSTWDKDAFSDYINSTVMGALGGGARGAAAGAVKGMSANKGDPLDTLYADVAAKRAAEEAAMQGDGTGPDGAGPADGVPRLPRPAMTGSIPRLPAPQVSVDSQGNARMDGAPPPVVAPADETQQGAEHHPGRPQPITTPVDEAAHTAQTSPVGTPAEPPAAPESPAKTALDVTPVNTGRAPDEAQQDKQDQAAPGLSRQNRDRSRPASIEQMTRIANAPDYDRLGVGRSPNEAAPMVSVAGDTGRIPESDMGRTDRVTLGDGSKIPVRYAVVEASDALASHSADGTENAAYYAAPKAGEIRALNNGRTAGIQEAYRRGKAGQYRQAMIEDAQAHGVSPEAIRAKREPMLVRVYGDQENRRSNIGALSNPQSNLGMSATEQAANDARIVPVDLLDLGDSGSFDAASNRRFLDAFARAAQAQGEDASQIRDAQGNYSRQFMDRARAAVFHLAYGDDSLTALSAESADPDVRNILNALTMAAPDMAGIDPGPLDIRPYIAAAVHQIRDARARGLNKQQFLAQQDMFGRDPLVDRLVDLLWGQIRAPKKLTEALREMALFVQNEQAGAASGDMFGGAQVTIDDVIARGENLIRSRYGREQDTQQADLFGVGRPEGGRHADTAGPAGGQPVAERRAASDNGQVQEPASGSGPAANQVGEPGATQDLFGGFDLEPEVSPDTGARQSGTRPVDARRRTVSGTASLPSLKSRAAAVVIEPDGSRFAVRVEARKTLNLKVQDGRIETASDVASAMASIRKQPQENLMMLLTDADGRPISVLRHSIGHKAATVASPDILMGHAARVPKAANMWLVHNHPSGNPELSSADLRLSTTMARMLRNERIEYHGLMAVGLNAFSNADPSGGIVQDKIRPVLRAKEIPVMERVFVKRGALDDPVKPENVSRIAQMAADGKDGVLLLDVQHAPSAFLPMTAEEMGKLRGTGGLEKLMAGVEKSNASAAVTVVQSAGSLRQAQNLNSALAAADVMALDIVVDGKPVAETRQPIRRTDGTSFESRAPRPSAGVSDSGAEAAQHAATERAYGGRPAYERARSAGRTKLNFHQWVQVRTAAFKQWFGDWEAVRAQGRLDAITPVEVRIPDDWRGLPVEDLRQKMATELDRMMRERVRIAHPEVGEIKVGRRGLEKTVSSSRDPAKALIVANLESLLPQSVYARSEVPAVGEQGVTGYSALLLPVSADGHQMVAVFTLRHQQDGSWYYNAVALHDAKAKGRDSYGSPGTPARPLGETPISGLSEFIRRPLRRVNPATVSRVVDPDTGEPLVVYHGTNQDFDAFRYLPGSDAGFHFGSRAAANSRLKSRADTEGQVVMPEYLSVRNPLRLQDLGRWDNHFDLRDPLLRAGLPRDEVQAMFKRIDALENRLLDEGENDEAILARVQAYTAKQLQALLERNGYDGIAYTNQHEGTNDTSWAVFRPEQVKSATGNRGTFSATNPNITESKAQAGPRRGVSVSGARVFASAFMKKLPGAGRLKVSVVQSVRDIPEDAKPSDMAEGVYYPADEGGRIYLVADNLPTMERLHQVLAHEVVGHFGVEALNGGAFDSLLARVRRIARVPAGERATGNEQPGDATYATMEAVGMRYPDYDAKARAREVLARMAETGSHRSLLQALYAKIRAVLRGMGVKLELTDADLRQMVIDAGKFLRRAPADRVYSRIRLAAASMAASEGNIETKRSGELPAVSTPTTKAGAVRAASERGSTISDAASTVNSGDASVESRRDGAPVDLPDAIVGRALGDAGSHPDYKAAKAGDTQAAGRLVDDLVTPEVVAKVRDALGDSKPAIVPVLAVESAGHNKIPLATADRLGADLGLDVDTNIYQSVKAKRTALSGLDRIFQQPEFDGAVRQGGQYLLVDDTLTQGGTMAALASHIRQNGGEVVGTFALTGKQYSATLRLSPETLKVLRERYGDIENEFRAATGRGLDGLTESEGRYLAKHGTPDSVRARILAEGHARGFGILQKDLGPQESGLSDQQDETKAPPSAGPSNSGPVESRAARSADQAPADKAPAKPSSARAEKMLRDKMLEESGVFAGEDTLRDRFDRLRENWKVKTMQGVFDHFLSLKSLNPTAYMQARLSKGTDGAAEYLVRHGAVKLTDGALGGAGGKGLGQILADLKGEHDHFMAWIAGNRAERLMAEGKERLLTPAIIERFKNLNKGTMADGRRRREVYAQALKDLNVLQMSVLDVAQDAGLIDGSTRHLWEHEFYVPFYRVMDGDNTGTMGPGQIGGLVGQYAFKRLKGGRERLGDLTANTIANWSHLLSASMKNLAAQGAIKSAVDIGIAEQVPAAQKGSVRIMVRGHEQHYLVDDPLVLDSLTSLHYAGSNDPIMRAMRKFKHALTIGVTLSPTFRIRNLLRDSLQAVAIDSDIKLNPVANMIQGWKSTGAESDTMRTLLVGGGAVRFGSFNDGQARNVKRLVSELQVDPSQVLASPKQLVAFAMKTFDWYQELGDRGETVNRAAIYEAARKNGKSHLEASFLARDLMDFTNTGAWASVRLLTQVVPFMNARLQGVYKLGRGAVNDPARFFAVTGTMALASAALFLTMKDDKDYKELPDWARNNYWVAKIGNKMVFIPKPFEVGALGSVVERATELAFAGDDYRVKDFGKTMLGIMGDQLALNPVPQMFMPAAEAAFNYDTFRGRTIDSESQQHLPPGERFHASTSAGAIALGRAIGVSPQRIEHLATGYFGWLGMQALNAADYLFRPLSNLPENPRRDLARIDNWFVVGDLVKDQDARTTKYIQRFYDMQKDVNQVYAAYNQARAMGDVERARDLANSDTAKLYDTAKRAGRDMTRVTQEIRKLERDKAPMAEKRARLDELYAKRNDTARRADEIARATQ